MAEHGQPQLEGEKTPIRGHSRTQHVPERQLSPIREPRDGFTCTGRTRFHGLRPEQALKRVAQLLHQARVQGAPEVEIITGRGLGNAKMSPVLRTRVEAWLLGPEGRRHGALSFQRQAKGGALRVKVQRPR